MFTTVGFDLLRAGNALILRGYMTMNADYASITSDELVHMLGDYILEKNSEQVLGNTF